MSVRVRFAPSPTGQVHIGNIRTAIFNWLFARHEGGRFLLRIEDTDRERSTPEAVRTVLDALAWLGIDHDEEPMYQSARQAEHLAAADRLLAAGRAYREDKGGTGQGECTVFRMPQTDITFRDEIKGELRKSAEDLKDFVIVRSNGTPVFHLANVVDDIEMRITHVMRGDDHIENTYRHVALYRALDAEVPRFAHLSMIVNAQGKPYSKRDGAAFVGEFRDRGYLPDALFNFLSLLGWSPGEDREVLSRDELVALFGLDRVRSAPARMDMEKLLWMNGEYMRALPQDAFRAGCRQVVDAAGLWAPMRSSLETCPASTGTDPDAYFDRVLVLMRERVRLYPELAGAAYFFTEDYAFEAKAVRKRLNKADVPGHLEALCGVFPALPDFSAATLEERVRAYAEEHGVGAGALIHGLRVAVSGTTKGPGLFELLALLGRERVCARIARALAQLG